MLPLFAVVLTEPALALLRYGRGGRGALPLIAVLVGIGLVFNSIRMMLSREGMYDADSTNFTTWINILCVVGGAAMAGWGGWTYYRFFAPF